MPGSHGNRDHPPDECVPRASDVAKALVRGPRPTKYCCRELKGVPAPEAEVALCRIPGQVHPPGRVVQGLSSGARGNHPYSGGEVTIVCTPQIRVMLWGRRTDAAGQTTGLCVRQLGSQDLLFEKDHQPPVLS